MYRHISSLFWLLQLQWLLLLSCQFLPFVVPTTITTTVEVVEHTTNTNDSGRNKSPSLRQQQQQSQTTTTAETTATRILQNEVNDDIDNLVDDPNCQITCFNDGICQAGNSTFTSHPVNALGEELEIHHVKNIKGYHCICRPGYTGVSCNIQYESCADANSSHVCYHGGTCLPGQMDELGNEQYYCDCSSAEIVGAAYDEDSTVTIPPDSTTTTTTESGSRYAGKYCENVAMQICDNGSTTQTFCVNDGQCKDTTTTIEGEAPCTCGDEFTGAHCEFSIHDQQVPTDCNLLCQNGGTCQVGIPTDGSNHGNEGTNALDFTYCLCPENYHGLLCETIKSQPCGDEHICYHGSQCIQGMDDDSGNEFYYCDCSTIVESSSQRHVGRWCQYVETDTCDNDNGNVAEIHQNSLCTNGGTCKENPTAEESPCSCDENHTGAHCEYNQQNDVDTETLLSTTGCDLNCLNGGSCQIGIPLYHDDTTGATVSTSLKYCLCPIEFHGKTCEESKQEPCGDDHICYHGSHCVQETMDDGSDLYYCDCNSIGDGSSSTSSSVGTRYAGRFCQYEETDTCTNDNGNVAEIHQNSLCTNGGTCKENPVAEESPCICDENHTGAHCEYNKQLDADSLTEGCNLNCLNGGSCQIGKPLHGGYGLTEDENYATLTYCLCPENFHGVTCEKMKEQPCGDEHICYHGSTCLLGQDKEDGSDLYYCDCSVGIIGTTNRYTGRFCQYESDICENPYSAEIHQNTLCANGGTCKENPTAQESPCICGTDYTGAHCEYHTEKDAAQLPTSCDLNCLNGGSCQFGVPMRFPDGQDDDGITSLSYCLCPEEFHGKTCEIARDVPCGDEHICYHGSTCIQGTGDEGNDLFYCDCTVAATPMVRYAGQFCQYESTDICGSNPTSHTAPFCVNDGTCKSTLNAAEAPCNCGSEYKGANCEYHIEKDAAQLPDDCTLDCENGGSCQFGSPIMQDNEGGDETIGYTTLTYCLCPEGFRGKRCEIEKENPCGDVHVCYHGGKCVEAVEEDGDDDFYCACLVDATTRRFAGRFCEYEATEICADNHNGVSFCVNFGTCVDEGAGIYSCECPEGFHGPRCEFPDQKPVPTVPDGVSTDVPIDGTDVSGGGNTTDYSTDYEDCTLECFNNGACREGVKDLSGSYLNLGPELSDPTSVDTSAQLNKASDGDRFEHCVCPVGFTGVRCEYKVDECKLDPDSDDVQHICLHGSTCRQVPGTQDWTCDCEDAFTENKKYAGKFCQHHHTSTCTNDQQSGIYQGPSSFAFCVNDGICVDFVENGQSHPGCKCPDAYHGVHCELLKTVRPGQTGPRVKTDDTVGDSAIIFTLIILSIVLIVLTVAIAYRLRERAKLNLEDEDDIVRADHTERRRLNQPGTNMEEIEFSESESELEEVELL